MIRLRNIKNTLNSKGTIVNAFWLIAEKLGVLALALFANIFIARHLGSSDFGNLNYAIALIAIFSPLTYLGLNSIVIRDLINDSNSHEALLGSSFILKLIASLIIVISFISFAPFFIKDQDILSLLIILSLGSIFESFLVISFWYLSQSEARYYSLACIIAVAISSFTKITFVILDKSLIWFGYATLLQAVITACILIYFYASHRNNVFSWRFQHKVAFKLLKKSWPLALSAGFALIYLKIDQVMLGSMVSSSELGLYSAASRLSEIWYVLPTALATAVFPKIVNKIQEDSDNYNKFLLTLYSIALIASIFIAIPISLTSDFIINLLYGKHFLGSGYILSIHIWACPAMFLGAIYAKVLIAEDLMKLSLFRDIFGSVINVVLNLYLIPFYGGVGAAIATVISYSASTFITPFLFRQTRTSGILMISSIVSPIIYLKYIYQKK